MTLWTWTEVKDGLKSVSVGGSRQFHGDEPAITGVSIDSRTLHQGDIFFAIQGDATDGHRFLPQALSRGASVVVVAQSQVDHVKQILESRPHIVVTDTLKAMEALGSYARARSRGTIIGVTGSVGKTSICHALGFLLSRQGKVTVSQKSYNNHWGVPLSLCQLDGASQYGVFEMGMNARGEIAGLVRQVKPHVALITKIGEAHLGKLGSIEAIAEAKSEIFSGLQEAAVVNMDSPCAELMMQRAREAGAAGIVTFGRHRSADVHLMGCLTRSSPEGCLQLMTISVAGKEYEVCLTISGGHWVDNVLALLATLLAAGADITQAASDMGALTPLEGRGLPLACTLPNGDRFTILDDGYNANPTSVLASLQTLSQFSGRKIAVLGDMLELGDCSRNLHIGLKDAIEKAGVERVYACGQMMQHLFGVLPRSLQGFWAPTSAELCGQVRLSIQTGDVVLIKGSNGMKMKAVLDALKAVDPAFPQASIEN